MMSFTRNHQTLDWFPRLMTLKLNGPRNRGGGVWAIVTPLFCFWKSAITCSVSSFVLQTISYPKVHHSSGEDKGRARRAQHDQFFYLKLFFFYANNRWKNAYFVRSILTKLSIFWMKLYLSPTPYVTSCPIFWTACVTSCPSGSGTK